MCMNIDIYLQDFAHGVLAGDVQYVKNLLTSSRKLNINIKNLVSLVKHLLLALLLLPERVPGQSKRNKSLIEYRYLSKS